MFDAARPLPVDNREAFLESVSAAIATLDERGPGSISGFARDLQRRFFDPPSLRAEPVHNRRQAPSDTQT